MSRINAVTNTLYGEIQCPQLNEEEYIDTLRGAARALDAAGHLMPDLPEPAETDGVVYFGDAPEICSYLDGQVHVLDDGVWRPTTAESLREDAAAMLAAANYAEEHADDQ